MDFILDPGLVLYLPLYEPDGSSLMSKDHYGHLATVTGTLWTPRGRTFDGVDDIITCGSVSQVDSLTTMTVEAWVKPNVGTFGVADIAAIVSKYGVTDLGGGWISHKAQFYPWFTGGVQHTSGPSVTSIDDGNFHHIAGIYDGDYLRIYVDGIQENISAHFPGLTFGTSLYGLSLGARTTLPNPNDHFFAGIIGEIRVYNRALSALEVQQNYLKTRWRYV